MDKKEIAVRESVAAEALSKAGVERVRESVSLARQLATSVLTEGVDYDTVPKGNPNGEKVLLQPGAEKVAMAFQVYPEYEVVNKVEDWDKPFFYYQVKCVLYHRPSGTKVGEAIASVNSREKRYAKQADRIYDLVHTMMMVVQKRAFVKAIRTLAGLSEFFTQDLEELDVGVGGEETIKVSRSAKPEQDNRMGAFIDKLSEKEALNLAAAVARAIHYEQEKEDIGAEGAYQKIADWDDAKIRRNLKTVLARSKVPDYIYHGFKKFYGTTKFSEIARVDHAAEQDIGKAVEGLADKMTVELGNDDIPVEEAPFFNR